MLKMVWLITYIEINLRLSLIYLGIKTVELDNLIAETSAYLNILHPDYGRLAARVAVTQLHKSTSESFLETIKILYNYTEVESKILTLSFLLKV